MDRLGFLEVQANPKKWNNGPESGVCMCIPRYPCSEKALPVSLTVVKPSF